VSFRTHHTLTGYARVAVDLKARMDEHVRGAGFREFLDFFLDTTMSTMSTGGGHRLSERVGDTVSQAAGSVWRIGEPFVLAPAMTAIVAAAAQALDLTGEVVAEQVAPCDWGVLFLPEPIYHRNLDGTLSGMAAITWAPVSGPRGRMWLICAWADRADPQDPHAARVRAAIAERPELSAMLGPYVLTDLADLVIGVPVPARADLPQEVDEAEREWETNPQGRYVIAEHDAPTRVCAAILYAFWRIATQPLATVARAAGPCRPPPRRPRPGQPRHQGGDAAPAGRRPRRLAQRARAAVALPGAVRRARPLAAPARPGRQPVPDLDSRLHQGH
jgi:hypothetical protein